MKTLKDLQVYAKSLKIKYSGLRKAELEKVLKEKELKKAEKVTVETKIENPQSPGEFQTITKEVEVDPSGPTLLGSGGLSGEYRFKEIPGSVSGKTVEEAIQKAKDIMANHKALTIKL